MRSSFRSWPIRRPKGFTLIEFMLAVGVGVAVSAAVWVAYTPRQRAQEAGTTRQALFEVIAQSNKAYASEIGFFTTDVGGAVVPIDMTQYVNAVRATPISLTEANGVYTHMWGGEWDLTAENSTCAPDCALDLITQTLTGVPPWACTQLVNTSAPYLYDTTVNGDLVALDPEPVDTSPGRNETRGSQVAELCAQEQNTLVFRDLKEINFTNFRQIPMTNVLLPGEAAALNPQYARVMAAMAEREAAQSGIK